MVGWLDNRIQKFNQTERAGIRLAACSVLLVKMSSVVQCGPVWWWWASVSRSWQLQTLQSIPPANLWTRLLGLLMHPHHPYQPSISLSIAQAKWGRVKH